MHVMRTKHNLFVAAKTALALLLTATASANAHAAQCYSLYDSANKLVYQSREAPVPLSGSISEEIAAKFPGYFLVISEEPLCQEVKQLPGAPHFKDINNSRLFRESEGIGSSASEEPSAGYYPTQAGGRSGGTANTPGRDISVRAYTKKDGTYVQSHTRAASGRGR